MRTARLSMRTLVATAALLMPLMLIATSRCAQTGSTRSAHVIVSPSGDGSTGIAGVVIHEGSPLPGVTVTMTGPSIAGIRTALTDVNGNFSFVAIPPGEYTLKLEMEGMQTHTRLVAVSTARTARLDVEMRLASVAEAITVTASSPSVLETPGMTTSVPRSNVPFIPRRSPPTNRSHTVHAPPPAAVVPTWTYDTEEYRAAAESGFKLVKAEPLSTFAIDVDRASYTNVRRFVTQNMLPPVDAVRIEEMINYFPYAYAEPHDRPVDVTTEVAACPWNAAHRLLHVGLQAKHVDVAAMPDSNIVFLIDVSGSMDQPDKLPLVKQAFLLLVDQLRASDRVAIVVYAGAAGLVLPSTAGSDKQTIRAAIGQLQAGGSTAGGAGILLAYQIAKDNFIPKGNNRVILATDGDFNVGISADDDLERLITEKRDAGIFLSVLGFGTGNYKDAKMEILADKGNGNYAYVDNLLEAKKVFVDEMAGTLLTVAKDVKVQVEFNPVAVGAYRLIGYDNRALAAEDFKDDRKDAGEMGAGNSVTALYEIVPAGREGDIADVDPLRYQKTTPSLRASEGELATVTIRYKLPAEGISRPFEQVVIDDGKSFQQSSENFRFAAAVAELGMLLRSSPYRGTASFDDVISFARDARGDDAEGYRNEFVQLAQTCRLMVPKVATK